MLLRAAAVVAALLSLGSCSSAPASVIVPGRPGESASVVPADRAGVPDGNAYNSSDAEFVRMMIPHHEQAVEMAALASTRAADPRIRAIAKRIQAAQGPEIGVLRAWLTARGLAESTHDHQPALASARGAAFDRMFVAAMIAHHQAAVDMAKSVLATGRNGQVEELATAIATEQSAEIARLRDLVS
jgi:uncharacterized protein (DUF305 family)